MNIFELVNTFTKRYIHVLSKLIQQASSLIFYNILINEKTIYIIFQEEGHDQQRAAKWGSWAVVGGLKSATFTSRLDNPVRLTTSWTSRKCTLKLYVVICTRSSNPLQAGFNRVRRIKRLSCKLSKVWIPHPQVNSVVDGNSLSPCPIPHLTWWDLVWFYTTASFRRVAVGPILLGIGDTSVYGACHSHHIHVCTMHTSNSLNDLTHSSYAHSTNRWQNQLRKLAWQIVGTNRN